jgi:diacylglycerol kinase (ATP)
MKKLFNSAKYAVQGLLHFIRTDRNGQLELICAVIAVTLGCWLQISTMEWCLIIICIGVVLAAEMFNHAIEKSMDFITQERHKEIGVIKDVAASAVMMTVFMSLTICYIILFSKIISRFL